GQYDIIVSNPPYIPSKDIEDLMPEVKNHEPVAALDGSADGLLFYRRITAAAKGHLLPEGYIFYEIGYNQGEAVKQIMIQEGFTDVSIIRDLSGLDRVAFGKKS
ncbi:MAG: HemK/PrmC family methyltransferase, partial [Mobilitalea sp.]